MASRSLISTTALVAALASLATACGGDDDDAPWGNERAPTASAPTAPSAPATTPSAGKSPGSPAPQQFTAKVNRVKASTLKYSWRKGCPVPPSRLRLIEMTYWGMDDKAHTGKLVVNASAANDLVGVFRKLYRARYPIRRMELVDVYKGSDFDSIEANNTSAFNCRAATGSGNWSQHAYGLAVDINPCENPYVTADGSVAHKDCVKFRNRKRRDPGLIHKGDGTVRAFASIGWGWGGTWSGTSDYQHFSSSGR